jgi:hypothetical protein
MSGPAWTALPLALAAAAFRPALLLVFPVAANSQQRAGSPPTAVAAANGTVTAQVVEAANAFLAALSAAERTKCTFSFNGTQRTGWSNLPSGIFQRNGLRFRRHDAAATPGGPGAGRRGLEP